MGFSDTYDLFCGRQQYLQSEFPVCLRGCASAAVLFSRLFHIGNTKTVQEFICLCGMTVCVCFLSAVVLDQDRYKILHLTCLNKYYTLFVRKFLACFDGIVYSVAEKGADVKRLYEIYTTKINKSRKVDMLFTGFLCFISYDNITVLPYPDSGKRSGQAPFSICHTSSA